ncbi:MAG: hypothetical protein QOF60_2573 [Actinomycetota bacterium]|jgi:uncharacterized repeat protein (TIGR01451 family)|nr:hypothetical protein [Actinomycetota bacterium]
MLLSLIAAMTGGILAAGLLQPAQATLTGSSFNGLDASPTADLTAGAIDIVDPSGNSDTTNYTNGSDEDTICPGVGTGTAPNSTDFDHFYFGTESNASGVFVYLGWHRISNNGTKTLDFELNQSSALAPGCANGVTPARTAGDVLISYDFSGGGGVVTLNRRIWVGTSSAGVWGAPTALVTGEEASVNLAGDFGEMVINGTTSGMLTAGVCTNFASAYAKSHSSNSFGSELKDFTPGVQRNVSNCGSVVINKVDDASPALAVDGATFTLYTDVAGAPGVSTTKTCVTASGTCTIGNILPGTYWVLETGVPAGYTGAAARQVTVGITTNSPTNPLTFVDARLPASVIINKADNSSPAQPLNGAVFALYTDNAGVIGTAVAGKTCTTAGLGTCTISNILPAGTYWVRETTTPTGYSTAADQQVVLALNQVAALNFVDNRVPATVVVNKVDDASPAHSLNGAVFGLFTDNAGVIGTAISGKTCTTAGAGTCSITGILPPGTYWVRETTTPPGYTTAADQQVTVALGQTLTTTFVDTRKPATVNIVKHDDLGANLSGATFGLFNDNAGAIGTAVAGKTCTTGGAGTCSIANILPPGTYWLSETTTPVGYTTAADQQVTLALDQTVTLTFVDPRKPATINIVKRDDLGAPLAGAVLSLFTDNAGTIGTAVVGKTCTTSTAGTCSITGILPAGTYWVRETTTPAGFDTAADQKVTLALDQTATLTFVDNRKPVSIALGKTVNGNHPTQAAPLMVEAGSTLTYVITVTNNGTLPLTISTLTDTLKTNLPASCTQGLGSTLASGASFTCTYTSIAGKTENNLASVTAADARNNTVNASDQTFVAPIHPAIGITKAGPALGHVGDVVTYELTVVNSGDIGLTNVVPSDPKCSAAPQLKSKTGGNQDAVLDLGETWTYTCTHTITAADGNSFTNTALAGAVDPLGTTVSSNGTHTLGVLHPGIAVVKTASPTSAGVGTVVTYTYVITNTGDTALTNVVVDDDILGRITTIATLDKGASVTATKTMTVTATSPVTNVATAKGTDPTGLQVSATSKATISIVLGETLTAPAAAPELPRTGAPLDLEARLALTLIGFGCALLLLRGAAGRRRPGGPALATGPGREPPSPPSGHGAMRRALVVLGLGGTVLLLERRRVSARGRRTRGR